MCIESKRKTAVRNAIEIGWYLEKREAMVNGGNPGITGCLIFILDPLILLSQAMVKF